MKATTRRSILVVDENPRLLVETMESLSQVGYHVHSVTRATTALRLIQTRAFDAVILDATSTQLSDGLALISAIKGSMPSGRTLIILLDSTNQHECAEKYRELGCEHFLSKPINLDGLCRILNDVFGTHALAEIEVLSQSASQQQVRTD